MKHSWTAYLLDNKRTVILKATWSTVCTGRGREKEVAMEINLVWNTHSSKWGKRTEDYDTEWKIQLTAQKEKQLKEA